MCVLFAGTMNPDWGGLPDGLMSHVFKHLPNLGEETGLRAVSKTWRLKFDVLVSNIAIGFRGPAPPSGGTLHDRFPSLTGLDLGPAPLQPAQLLTLAQVGTLQNLSPGIHISRAADAPRALLVGQDFPEPPRNPADDLAGRMGALTVAGVPQQLGPITRLDVAGCSEMSDAVFGALVGGMQLDALDASGTTSITDAGIAFLAGLPLRRLDLGRAGAGITAAGLAAALPGLPLTDLGLSHAPASLGPPSLAALQGLPLTRLDLSYSPELITQAGLGNLQGLPLTRLDLSAAYLLGHATLVFLVGMPLRDLVLDGCSGISADGLSHLRGLPLEKLSMTWCSGLGLDTITELGLFTHPPSYLSLARCKEIHPLPPGADFSPLLGWPLTSLDLSWAYNPVRDPTLATLVGMPLTKLKLYECKNITDAGLAHLGGIGLVDLNLGRCSILGPGLAHLTWPPWRHCPWMGVPI